jgi:hypothetical protein
MLTSTITLEFESAFLGASALEYARDTAQQQLSFHPIPQKFDARAEDNCKLDSN